MTLVVVLLASAPIVLANLVEAEEFVLVNRSVPVVPSIATKSPSQFGGVEMLANEYGWPWPWVWMDSAADGPSFDPQTCNWQSTSLAKNVAAWLTILAATARVCELVALRWRPRFRFGLRTALAVVAMIALALAAYEAAGRRVAREDQLCDLVGQRGGLVYFELRGPRWLKLLGLQRRCAHVVGAEVLEPGNLSALVDELATHHGLRFLDIDVTDFSPQSVGELSRLKSVTILRLTAREISDELVETLVDMPRLRTLDVSACTWNKAADKRLGRLHQLQALGLRWADPNDLPGVASLPHLSDLRMQAILGLPEPKSAVGFAALKTVRFTGGYLNEVAAEWLATLPALEGADLRNAEVRPEAIVNLRHCKSLTTIVLGIGCGDLGLVAPYNELRSARPDITWGAEPGSIDDDEMSGFVQRYEWSIPRYGAGGMSLPPVVQGNRYGYQRPKR